MKKKVNNTHLTYEGRLIIENLLNDGKTVTEISNITRRDRSNINREIIKHRTISYSSVFNNRYPCIKHETCNVKSYECYLYCKNIEINLCPKLTSSPHVCNSCTSKKGCRYVKYYYKALKADCEYRNNWRKDRTGLHYTDEELRILNTDFYYLVLKNKSIYHSLKIINNRGFNFKSSTIYKQIERNEIRLKRSDLPRKRKKFIKEEIDNSYKRNVEGHTYEDYKNYKINYPNANEVQMDTVEGTKENNVPVVLTLEIIKINFLFIFKLDNKKNAEVIRLLSFFQNTITKDIFNKLMEILLTDNGSEFITLETFIDNFKEINVFYCHPYSSYEKGSIENNHELIRRVIPKGVSLKPYSQAELNLLSSHINSLCRNNLNGKCPFDLIDKYVPLDKIKDLGLSKIKEEDVTLIPELLGNKNVDNIKKYLDDLEISNAHIRFLTDEEKRYIFRKKGNTND